MDINTVKIALWNANGLQQHRQEVELYLKDNNIDIFLISETHFTNRSYFKIPGYTMYETQHPSGRAHGGSAILIKNQIQHFELPKFQTDYIQATNVNIFTKLGPINISAAYLPPRHSLNQDNLHNFFLSLGHKFILGGDFNAKHIKWGSRLNTSRGRALYKYITEKNLESLSAGQPTYWPTDQNKIPDLLDFYITSGLSDKYFYLEPGNDLYSDHSVVEMYLSTNTILKKRQFKLYNKQTHWPTLSQYIETNINLKLPLKSHDDINHAVEELTKIIQEAGTYATPQLESKQKAELYPATIVKKLKEKRRLRKNWQNNRSPETKKQLNKATAELKSLLLHYKNSEFEHFITHLTPTSHTDFSLWKITKKFKRPQLLNSPIRTTVGWTRSDKEKAAAFAQHLEQIYQPFPSTEPYEWEEHIKAFLDSPLPMSKPPKPFTPKEIKREIATLKSKKAPGHDYITSEILKNLERKALVYVCSIFNAILRTNHIPDQWKVSQIIMIPKPGKSRDVAESYRPISLLPILSKMFEKLLLKRMTETLTSNNIVPDHQFGFRVKHSTIEQLHRVTHKISESLENKEFCAAVFLDVKQAFDKVWHTGLLYKLKSHMPEYYLLMKNYLTNRVGQVRVGGETSTFIKIASGVPQGTVLGPTLYNLYTADLPSIDDVTTATYADDTALLVSHQNQEKATVKLQHAITEIEKWLSKWRIKLNEDKCTQVTFTMRRDTCNPITIHNKAIPTADHVKYLGMHLDRRLTWKLHVLKKRKELDLKVKKMYWLIGRRSKLSLQNKVLIYKTIIKPVWTYGIELWGTTSTSNLEILQRFQSKTMRLLTDAPWFVRNANLHKDLQIPTIRDEISRRSRRYQSRISDHPNEMARSLLSRVSITRRLKRIKPLDLMNI